MSKETESQGLMEIQGKCTYYFLYFVSFYYLLGYFLGDLWDISVVIYGNLWGDLLGDSPKRKRISNNTRNKQQITDINPIILW
jgi:hypothetical protein